MDDVSRVIGRTVITWNGNDYILDNFGFDDWSALQSWLVREKRGRILKAVLDLKGQVDDEAYAGLYQDALNKVGAVSAVTDAEIEDFLNSEEGISFVVWVLIERRYPGKVKRTEVAQMIRKNALTPDMVIELMDSVAVAMGDDPAGNSTGRSGAKSEA